jgi:heme exporter protein B
MRWKEVKALIAKEVLFELRQMYAINGMLLYMISCIFIGYISFRFRNVDIEAALWNGLFWIIILFTAVSALAKSFLQEGRGVLLYYYQLCSAQSLILARMIYNSLLMLVLVFVGLGVYVLFLTNPIQNLGFYSLVSVMGAVGFSAVFTMISSIASKASNGGMLMAVLGFPIVIPILLMILKLSRNALEGATLAGNESELMVLAAIIVISVTTSLLLFPYLWRSN